MGGLDKRLKEIKKALEGKKAVAGWFESATYTDTGKSVASIASVHEYGAILKTKNKSYMRPSVSSKRKFTGTVNIDEPPAKRIPARPFMRPTIASKKKYWGDVLASEVKGGNKNPLETVALVMAGDIRDAVIAVKEPPLKRSTIKAREKRGNSDTSPLEDTGRMLATLIGVVSEDT